MILVTRGGETVREKGANDEVLPIQVIYSTRQLDASKRKTMEQIAQDCKNLEPQLAHVAVKSSSKGHTLVLARLGECHLARLHKNDATPSNFKPANVSHDRLMGGNLLELEFGSWTPLEIYFIAGKSIC